MSIAIDSVQQIPSESVGLTDIDVDEQVAIRREIVDEMQIQVEEFNSSKISDPLFISYEDFLKEQFQIMAQLTSKPQFLD